MSAYRLNVTQACCIGQAFGLNIQKSAVSIGRI